jgi:pimeloyl-ACP methyl ester carboxylesterase
MSGAARRAGLVAGAAGLLAAGAAVGLAAERYAIGRIRHAHENDPVERYGRLPADRRRTVTTEDGIPLQVEEVGPADAPITVVFVHGYSLAMGSWHYQRRGLADMRRPAIRMVFYDQRSHGRSGRAPSETASIDQLGRDLELVIEQTSPDRPVVLVGHSMGGMTIMALADAQPELFGSRVLGVALLSTSTGRLAEVTLGLPSVLARLRVPVLPFLMRGMRRRAALVERSRRIGSDIAWLLTRRYSFGSREVSPALVEYVGQMIAATPVEVIADFYPALHSHDKLAALGVLHAVESIIVVGEKDLLTPADHSRAMAEVVPDAELTVIDGAGHLVMMERPELVNLRLRAFLHRAARRSGGGLRSRTRKA